MAEIRRHQKWAPRYLGVSLACILFNNALLILLDDVGVHYAVAVLISAMVMIPAGFLLQSRFTFAASGSWHAFFRYTTVLIVNIPLAWLLLWAIHDQARLPMLYASPLMTLMLFVWNYLASGWAILARPSRPM